MDLSIFSSPWSSPTYIHPSRRSRSPNRATAAPLASSRRQVPGESPPSERGALVVVRTGFIAMAHANCCSSVRNVWSSVIRSLNLIWYRVLMLGRKHASDGSGYQFTQFAAAVCEV